MKVLWALVEVLESIRAQLSRLNTNLERSKPDLSRQMGETENDYFRRLKKYGASF